MKIGMLWFDNSQKTELADKILQAAEHYEVKYGQKPNLVYVHPSMFGVGDHEVKGIELRSLKEIRPHHLWIGVKND